MSKISAPRKLWYALTQRMETVLIRKGDTVTEYPVKELSDHSDWKLSKNMAEYAVFSALVYLDVNDNSSVPQDFFADPIIPEILSKWQFVNDQSLSLQRPSKDSGRRLVPGLKYHLWYSKEDNELLIVFRGTSGFNLDWWANFRWITRYVPRIDDHYDVVRLGMQDLVDRIRHKYNVNVNISTTGHSLGGGLAQHAAYSSSGIKNVYAFNSSPVTEYHEVDESIREKNAQGLKILRIFEHGEVLAFLRLPLRLLYPLTEENPEIQELRFNLLTRTNLITEHSIKALSEFLYIHTKPVKEVKEMEPPQTVSEE